MGCAPSELGARLTAEEFFQLQALWAGGELQG
jgi:hypothetical protein